MLASMVLCTAALLGQLGGPRQPVVKVFTPPEYAFTPVLNDAKIEKFEAAMKLKLDLNFKKVPLHEVLEYLQKASKLSFHPDTHANKQHENLLDLPVTINVAGIRLDSALDLILRDYDLAWFFQDETVVITTEDVSKTVLQTRIFGVADLLDSAPEYPARGAESIIAVIASVIAPTTWTEVGGQGAIQFEPITKSLVVVQSYRVIEEITTLLASLRQARSLQEAAAGIAGKNRDIEPTVAIYRLPANVPLLDAIRQSRTAPGTIELIAKAAFDESAAATKKFAEIIPQVIEPTTWQANGGTGLIFAVGDQLIVRQSAQIQREIKRLLAAPTSQPGMALGVGAFEFPTGSKR